MWDRINGGIATQIHSGGLLTAGNHTRHLLKWSKFRTCHIKAMNGEDRRRDRSIIQGRSLGYSQFKAT